MADALVRAGAQVVITGRDRSRIEQVAHGVGALGIACDVTDEKSVDRGVGAVYDELGGLDLLVNNAGLGMRTVNPSFLTEPQPFYDVSPDGFRAVVDTNLTG